MTKKTAPKKQKQKQKPKKKAKPKIIKQGIGAFS